MPKRGSTAGNQHKHQFRDAWDASPVANGNVATQHTGRKFIVKSLTSGAGSMWDYEMAELQPYPTSISVLSVKITAKQGLFIKNRVYRLVLELMTSNEDGT